MYVGFVITSYTGQELDDISKSKCHLFNNNTKMDLAQYQISKDKALDKHTGLLMACLYRNSDSWNLRVIGKAAHGKEALHLVDDLQHYLRNVPAPQPAFVPEPEIIVNAMPESIPTSEEEVVVNPFGHTGNALFVPTGNAPFVPIVHMVNAPFVPGSEPTSNVPSVPVPHIP